MSIIVQDAQWIQQNLRRNQLVMHIFWIAHPDKADLSVKMMNEQDRRVIELREGCGCIGAWCLWRLGFDMNKFVVKHTDPSMVMTREIANRWKVPDRDAYYLLHPWVKTDEGEANPYWPGHVGYKEEAVMAILAFAEAHKS